jgi:hypothetical protein
MTKYRIIEEGDGFFIAGNGLTVIRLNLLGMPLKDLLDVKV